MPDSTFVVSLKAHTIGLTVLEGSTFVSWPTSSAAGRVAVELAGDVQHPLVVDDGRRVVVARRVEAEEWPSGLPPCATG